MARVDPRGRFASRWRRVPLAVALVALLVFTTGVGPRPAGAGWGVFYDLLLYNLVELGSLVVCLQAAARHPREALAWRLFALAEAVNLLGNLYYTLVVARDPVEPPASFADVLYLAYYPPVYVGVVVLVRSRVTRFHRSMWLDGVIGALAATAVSVALLLRPALHEAEAAGPGALVAFAYPVADVIQFALMLALAGAVGLRRDRTLWLLAAGLFANVLGDGINFDLQATGSYVEGGPLDLTWLTGMALVALAAAAPVRSRPRVEADVELSTSSWRVLAVPVICTASSLAVLIEGWSPTQPRLAEWCAIGCVVAGLFRTGVTLREVRGLYAVREQARTDELTGLPNRRALLAGAEEMIASATAARPAALLLLDLDGFKEVNDGLGHAAGDDLLRLISPRLTALLGPGQLAARLGGDEFAVLLPDTSLEGALELAGRLREAISQPVRLAGITVQVGVSIGAAIAPDPAPDVPELLRCADVAMYAAKANGGGATAYDAGPDGGTGERLRTIAELREILSAGGSASANAGSLVVHLQPQVSLADDRISGAEALVRWQHPARGLLGPSAVLPAAEQAGLLGALTEHVLALALEAASSWWADRRVPVSVNLAPANLTDVELPAKVAAALLDHGLPPAALTLEVVEDTLMSDPEQAGDVLRGLRALGVRTAIDDYGTGYSSLAYLRFLPADELKLDRSLIGDLTSDAAAVAVVRHTVALAHDLGLSLVAEGVEDLETALALRGLDCDVAQGYALGRPMPVADFIDWLGSADRAALASS